MKLGLYRIWRRKRYSVAQYVKNVGPVYREQWFLDTQIYDERLTWGRKLKKVWSSGWNSYNITLIFLETDLHQIELLPCGTTGKTQGIRGTCFLSSLCLARSIQANELDVFWNQRNRSRLESQVWRFWTTNGSSWSGYSWNYQNHFSNHKYGLTFIIFGKGLRDQWKRPMNYIWIAKFFIFQKTIKVLLSHPELSNIHLNLWLKWRDGVIFLIPFAGTLYKTSIFLKNDCKWTCLSD